MDVQEVRKLDAYLKKLFGNARIRVVPRPKKEDSAEVYIGEEFIGVLFVDDEDDERSYNFQMAILGTRPGIVAPSRLLLADAVAPPGGRSWRRHCANRSASRAESAASRWRHRARAR